jgi:hypothetical protein
MKRLVVAPLGFAALLMAGCASGNGSSGTVTGTFQAQTGPVSASGQAAGKPFPVSGVIRFTDAAGHAVDVTVSASGKFSVQLPPGKYGVAGVTSALGAVDPHSGLSQPPCQMQNISSARVQAGQAVRIGLICYGP